MISGDEQSSLLKMNIHHILKKTPPQQTSHKVYDFVCNDEKNYFIFHYVHAVPKNTRRGHRIPQNWSYRKLLVAR